MSVQKMRSMRADRTRSDAARHLTLVRKQERTMKEMRRAA